MKAVLLVIRLIVTIPLLAVAELLAGLTSSCKKLIEWILPTNRK